MVSRRAIPALYELQRPCVCKISYRHGSSERWTVDEKDHPGLSPPPEVVVSVVEVVVDGAHRGKAVAARHAAGLVEDGNEHLFS